MIQLTGLHIQSSSKMVTDVLLGRRVTLLLEVRRETEKVLSYSTILSSMRATLIQRGEVVDGVNVKSWEVLV